MIKSFHFDIDYLFKDFNKIALKYWIAYSFDIINKCLLKFKEKFKRKQNIKNKPHTINLKLFVIVNNHGFSLYI
jgi:hypothetical protein